MGLFGVKLTKNDLCADVTWSFRADCRQSLEAAPEALRRAPRCSELSEIGPDATFPGTIPASSAASQTSDAQGTPRRAYMHVFAKRRWFRPGLSCNSPISIHTLAWLDVGVPEARDTASIDLRVCPRIHHRAGTASRCACKGRILARPRGALLPLPPKAINIRVMHPEDRVRRCCGDHTHGAAHPPMDKVVNKLQ